MANHRRSGTALSNPFFRFLAIEVTHCVGDIPYQCHMHPLVLRKSDGIPPSVLVMCIPVEIHSEFHWGSVHIESVSYRNVVIVLGWHTSPSEPQTEGEAFRALCDVKWAGHRICDRIPEHDMIICSETNTIAYWTQHNHGGANDDTFAERNGWLWPVGLQCRIVKCTIVVEDLKQQSWNYT